MEIMNARIESTTLSTADHGCLTGWIYLDYGSAGQGFGGFNMYTPGKRSIAGHFIWRVLEIAGVTDWESLSGSPIRVKADSGKVCAIGHYLKDEWFNPSEEFAALDNPKGS